MPTVRWRSRTLTNRKAIPWDIRTATNKVFPMSPFKAGDVVCLRSGGPDMTVERIEATIPDTSIICVWFVEQSLYRASFPISALSMALWPIAA